MRTPATPFFDNQPLESWAGGTEESSLHTMMTEAVMQK